MCIRDSWYAATIIEAEDARWKVKFDGYGDSSNEWVNLDRLRTLVTRAGFFVGVWGTSRADCNGARTEIDISAGWAGTLADFDVSGGAILYAYPGGTDTNTVELFGTVSLPLGPVVASLGLNWAPAQDNLARSNRYAFGMLSAGIQMCIRDRA